MESGTAAGRGLATATAARQTTGRGLATAATARQATGRRLATTAATTAAAKCGTGQPDRSAAV